MIYRDFTLIFSMGSINFAEIEFWKSENLTLALGITVYSFKIAGISMTIRNNMEQPLNFMRVFNLATIITCVIYLIFGVVT
jgi:amino acid permease